MRISGHTFASYDSPGQPHLQESRKLSRVLRFSYHLPFTVHITDYHWDRHLYFVIRSYHAQTMTHTPPSDDSILILRLVVLVACDSD
jgi:hypothetical protein